MDRGTAIKKLADLIEANPECTINIDNDYWDILDENGNEIAECGKYPFQTNWYGHSSNYGFGVVEALIALLNRRGFGIDASAV
jgi:hypothetical protein